MVSPTLLRPPWLQQLPTSSTAPHLPRVAEPAPRPPPLLLPTRVERLRPLEVVSISSSLRLPMRCRVGLSTSASPPLSPTLSLRRLRSRPLLLLVAPVPLRGCDLRVPRAWRLEEEEEEETVTEVGPGETEEPTSRSPPRL